MPTLRLGPPVLLLIGALALLAAAPAAADDPEKPLRAGMIGLTTSHVIAFHGVLNDPEATGPLADVEVVAGFPGGMRDNPASWGRVEKFTEQLRDKGVKIYDTIPEMLEHVDVVLLESVDGRPHLEQAIPVIEAGKPMFIDKPMAASLADVLEIFRRANEAKVPVFSSSSLRFSSGFQAVRHGEAGFGKVRRCEAWSPMSIEPHHPDLFWYGVHGVEILDTIMGTGCQTVERVEEKKVVGTWEGGREGVFIGKKGYGAIVEGTEKSGNAGGYEGYKPLVSEICTFFKTGKPPVPQEETIELFAFMEAADESKRQGGKPVSIQSVIEQAKEFNKKRNAQ